MERFKILNPKDDFISLNDFEGQYPIDVDMVYAKLNHPENHFKVRGEAGDVALYRPDSKLWVHKALGKIVLGATKYLGDGYSLSLKDCFRPGDAQLGMSFCSDKNGEPYPSSLVSQPGQGAHPLAMGIDIMLKKDGVELTAREVGTLFDYFDVERIKMGLPPESSRVYSELTDTQRANQKLLEQVMMRSALDEGLLIMPQEDEHWDFCFPASYASLWYVLKSIARILDVPTPVEPEWPVQSYAEFEQLWKKLCLEDHTIASRLQCELGHLSPPPANKIIYSGEYYPLLDEQVPDEMKMTDGRFASAAKMAFTQRRLIPSPH